MKEFIAECQKAYGEGKPLLTNEEYDALVRRFPNAEVNIGEEGEIPHMFRMYSLDKKYPCRGDELPYDLERYVKTPKLDGCAVDLLYIKGELVQCLTRGDGIKGRDCTANVSQLLPPPAEFYWGIPNVMQITGEVCVSRDVKNMRNYASGAVNLDDPTEFANRVKEGGLTFVAYSLQVKAGQVGMMEFYDDDMFELEQLGFNTVISPDIHALCDAGHIPTDGEVYRLNNNDEYAEAGYTHKFPKGAFAVKEDEECVWTTLREVEWGVGKSGKVTPTAVFDEIDLEGAKTTRATLNNVAFMQAMGITHIGQKLGVIRAGGIIPKIVEVEDYEELSN